MTLSCRTATAGLITLFLIGVGGGNPPASAASAVGSPAAHDVTREAADALPRWEWPVAAERTVIAPFRAPAHAYGAGHRGIDLAAGTDAVVTAPAAGVVAFRGTVVDRALLTIEHPGGLVTTFEPVTSDLVPGDAVDAGQPIGAVSTGGHTPQGTMHLGVRLDGAYINPMLLFGPVTRAVLLPCCGTP